MDLRKNIVQWLIMGTALAFYQIYGSAAWQSYLESSGAVPGTFELAIGYSGVFALAGVVSWWVTRRMKQKE